MSNVAFADKSQSGAYNAAKFNAADCNELKSAVNSKADAVPGKQLSQESYTTVEKTKLATLVPPEIAATYADIDTDDLTPRMIFVAADENNIGDDGAHPSIYMHTGSQIYFVITPTPPAS